MLNAQFMQNFYDYYESIIYLNNDLQHVTYFINKKIKLNLFLLFINLQRTNVSEIQLNIFIFNSPR